jgi:hypothetical protein
LRDIIWPLFVNIVKKHGHDAVLAKIFRYFENHFINIHPTYTEEYSIYRLDFFLYITSKPWQRARAFLSVPCLPFSTAFGVPFLVRKQSFCISSHLILPWLSNYDKNTKALYENDRNEQRLRLVLSIRE